ncbi:ABC transporter permease [Streptomyces sp. NPDC003077]|uniref:ABC transporter permease n=1 Tax=Streptomyces sp. NPDC003077 TaxID=3154443 RepID=UPI0033A8C5EB
MKRVTVAKGSRRATDGRRVAGFLAARSIRLHRKAWTAVFAALALTSLMLGAFGTAVTSVALGHAAVERYAATAAVIAGDQRTRHTSMPWGSEPRTETAALTERVRVPRSALPRIEAVPGVRAAVADDAFPVELGKGPAVGTGAEAASDEARPTYGHPWSAAALAPFTLRAGRAPSGPGDVVLDGGTAARLGVRVGDAVRVRASGVPETYRVSGIAAPEGQDAAPVGEDGAPEGRGGSSEGRAGAPDGQAPGEGLAHQEAVFFSDQRARHLAGHPDTVDAIGVLAAPGVSDDELYPRLRAALDGDRPVRSVAAEHRSEEDNTTLRVLTGNGRGEPEFLEATPGRSDLLEVLGSLIGVVVMVAGLVVASTVAQATRQRARDLALLRAVGATPRQVRSMVGRESVRVAAVAALCGALGAVPGYWLLAGVLRGGGAVPDGLVLPSPVWMFAAPVVTAALTVLVARLAAAATARRAASVSPARAMGEANEAPGRPGRGRTVTGLVLLTLGISASGTAALQSGQLAAMAASSAVLVLVIACAVLGPWIARGGVHVLSRLTRRRGGAGGYLAAAAARADVHGLAAAITPIVLVVAFIGVQLSAGATAERHATAQSGQALRAPLTVSASGPGIPEEALHRIRAVPGVAMASGVLRSTVVLADKEAGDPRLERLPVLATDPAALPRTLDPGAVTGDLRALRADTVAVGRDRAQSLDLKVGSRVRLRYGDGVEATLKVAAVYERAQALGDFLFAPGALAPHMAVPRPVQTLIALQPGADVGGVRDAVKRVIADVAPGAEVVAHPAAGHLRDGARDERQGLGQVVTVLAVGVIGGYTVIAVLSTLSLIMVGRRPELVLLRTVGAGRRQLRRMLCAEATTVILTGLLVGTVTALLPLTAFAVAVIGAPPWMPLAQVCAVVGVVAVTGLAGYLLPVRAVLRGRGQA